MFLNITQQRNPELLEAGVYLHQKEQIAPNTYLIDIDAVRKNTRLLVNEARKQDIELYFMTKQIGRNPLLSKAIVEEGIHKAVAVDPWEALALAEHGISIGHVGHLVQVPVPLIDPILDLNPDQITVFSYENAAAISEKAVKKGKVQPIILRVIDNDNFVYPGQEGGIYLEELQQEVTKIESLAGVRIKGVTNFPCLLVKDNKVDITRNFNAIVEAGRFLRGKGYSGIEINSPSVTTVNTLKLLKKHGGTQGEPGHSLTGTTPLHVDEKNPEIPAMIYVSEVSHIHNNQSFVYGGGFYPRSHVSHALVGNNYGEMTKIAVTPSNPENIDYYGSLDSCNTLVGNTVLYAFRTQIFVTNSQVAVVKNVKNNPTILGIFDSTGKQLR